jgi:tRNA U34 2-thiouridine synthase MnmA/TrmU
VGDEHLAVVKSPKFGRGKHMNPCVDCHLFMLKKARQIMEQENFDFIATGEVMGQRPMSQNPDALKKIAKEAGLEGRLLRPLSAKLLPTTEVEERGLVDRERLYSISGRGRQVQLSLVEKYKIKQFVTPAGGCRLTDPGYGKKLKELSERWPDYSGDDAILICHGRVFWEGDCLVVVARHKEECKKVSELASPKDYLIDLVDIPGPTTLVRGKKVSEDVIKGAIELTVKYAHQADKLEEIKVKVCHLEKEEIKKKLNKENS